MISRLNSLRLSQGKKPLGALGPLLYKIAKECNKCFLDITIGSNNSTEDGNCKYGYSASKGYDPVYGIGLPNYGMIENFIKYLLY